MRLNLSLQGSQLRLNGGAFGAFHIALALRQLNPAEVYKERNAACDQRENDTDDPDVTLVQIEESRLLAQEQLREQFAADSADRDQHEIDSKTQADTAAKALHHGTPHRGDQRQYREADAVSNHKIRNDLVPRAQHQSDEQSNDGIDRQRHRQPTPQKIHHRVFGAVERRK